MLLQLLVEQSSSWKLLVCYVVMYYYLIKCNNVYQCTEHATSRRFALFTLKLAMKLNSVLIEASVVP